MGKANRDKAAEKAVKSKVQKTHLKSFKIVGSEATDDGAVVYFLRMFEDKNYLFKINTTKQADGTYETSGFIPITDFEEFGEYRVFNPQPASAEVLRPTASERKKFKGYE